MEFERYKRYLAERIEREVLPYLFPSPQTPPPEGPPRLPPPHPLPPMMEEDIRRTLRYGTRTEAKRRVLEAIRYILESKRAVEEDLKKRLRPPLYVPPFEEVPEDLEDRFIGYLKTWAREKRQELDRLQKSSEQAAIDQLEQASKQGIEDNRMEYMMRFGPWVLILHPAILELIEKHNLLEDEEIRRAIEELDRELRKPPSFLSGEHIVRSIPEWYLRALHESYKKRLAMAREKR